MSPQASRVLHDALALSRQERAELVEQLLGSLTTPETRARDERWAAEAEARVTAFERGELATVPAAEVFSRREVSDHR